MDLAFKILAIIFIITGTVLTHLAISEILYYSDLRSLILYTVGLSWIAMGVYFVTSKKSNS